MHIKPNINIVNFLKQVQKCSAEVMFETTAIKYGGDKMQSVINIHSEPFFMLAGEVHNSNSSSTEVMEPIWQKAKDLNLNTLFLPVTWEMLEPEEGKFDFLLVDGLIGQARKYDIF